MMFILIIIIIIFLVVAYLLGKSTIKKNDDDYITKYNAIENLRKFGVKGLPNYSKNNQDKRILYKIEEDFDINYKGHRLKATFCIHEIFKWVEKIDHCVCDNCLEYEAFHQMNEIKNYKYSYIIENIWFTDFTWRIMSKMTSILTDDLIIRFQHSLFLNICLQHYIFSEDLLWNLKDILDWKIVCKYQLINKQFCNKFRNYIDWDVLTYHLYDNYHDPNVTIDEFIYLFENNLNIYYLYLNSSNPRLIKKYKDVMKRYRYLQDLSSDLYFKLNYRNLNKHIFTLFECKSEMWELANNEEMYNKVLLLLKESKKG